MFLIQGPHPLLQSSVVLPSPQTGNTIKKTSSVEFLKAEDGTVYTYVKSKRGRRLYRFDFVVSLDKAREVTAFVKLYVGKPVLIRTHDNETLIGYLTLNPFERLGAGRAKGSPGGESCSLTLEFEEKI